MDRKLNALAIRQFVPSSWEWRWETRAAPEERLDLGIEVLTRHRHPVIMDHQVDLCRLRILKARSIDVIGITCCITQNIGFDAAY